MKDITKWIFGNEHQFADSRELADRLLQKDSRAIKFLLSKSEWPIRKMVRQSGLPESVAPDLLHDGLIMLIEKIRDGVYNPDLSAPQTYLIGICKFLLLNRRHKAVNFQFSPIESNVDISDEYEIDLFKHKELEETIKTWLDHLGPPCSDLIRLKYLDEYSDQEQIEMKMTPYTSINSIRVTRSRCMDKLVAIAENWKKLNDAS